MKGLILLALIVALPLTSSSLDLESVATGAAADLQKATTELSAVRQQVEAERLPTARQISELEQRLIDRRAELPKAQRFQENQLVELNALKADAKRQSDEVKYIDSLLTEYARAFRSRLSFIEEPHYAKILDAVDRATASADLSPGDRFTQRAVLLATALQRAERAQGGELIEGKAKVEGSVKLVFVLTEEGRVEDPRVENSSRPEFEKPALEAIRKWRFSPGPSSSVLFLLCSRSR